MTGSLEPISSVQFTSCHFWKLFIPRRHPHKMFFPYTQAALMLVERGADLYQIDRAVTKFGMPMGLFKYTNTLCDLVGFGVAIATGTQFIENFPERTYKSTLIPIMQEDKRAVKASDLDIAAVMGMGFPPYSFVVSSDSNSLGSKYICSKLEEWSNVYDGGFFKPCAYLAERATKGVLPVRILKLIWVL
ncbi:hypothetical protein HYC85_018769 [Camellia sinensis]|uniref:3-hydroxyacyl-CoA dehydrogenase C-terminal domain-containing protein n=1 Tax=Camellia sinensis TaxID=4442 RepID=A0A7J7GV75_CAMSI|nr:hypothetical protein HYC85_018769 [Camellia sinensis]